MKIWNSHNFINLGFDDRFFSDGLYGFGAYFALDAVYSNSYAAANANGVRRMLLCNVLLGKVEALS